VNTFAVSLPIEGGENFGKVKAALFASTDLFSLSCSRSRPLKIGVPVLAFLGAVPTAWAALVAAGVEVDAQVAALVVGIPAALVILVSAVWNTIDSRRGLA